MHVSDHKRRGVTGYCAVLCGLLVSGTGAGASAAENWFPVRTHNPFLQIYGVPVFQGAEVRPAGKGAWRLSFDVANHADASTVGAESITLDGESYYLDLSYRRRVANWLELGIDIPIVAHANGILDNLIEDWHDLWGMSNAKRTGSPNELEFAYVNPRLDPFEMTDGAAGIGDVRLNAAVPLRLASLGPGQSLTLRGGLKLPTGDADELLGSGATDLSLALYYSGYNAFGLDRLDISAHAGVLVTGDSDLFGPIQENSIPFGGFAADWRFSDRLRGMAAVYAQGEFVDSSLDELGSSLQLIVGGDYRFAGNGLTLSFGVVEELFSDATVDFAIQVSLRHDLGGDH